MILTAVRAVKNCIHVETSVWFKHGSHIHVKPLKGLLHYSWVILARIQVGEHPHENVLV